MPGPGPKPAVADIRHLAACPFVQRLADARLVAPAGDGWDRWPGRGQLARPSLSISCGTARRPGGEGRRSAKRGRAGESCGWPTTVTTAYSSAAGGALTATSSTSAIPSPVWSSPAWRCLLAVSSTPAPTPTLPSGRRKNCARPSRKRQQSCQKSRRSAPGLPGYGEVLQSRIAGHGPHSESLLSSDQEAGVVVALASPQPEHDYFGDSVEEADYTITADGTNTALCLTVTALTSKYGYSSVSFKTRNGSCPTT